MPAELQETLTPPAACCTEGLPGALHGPAAFDVVHPELPLPATTARTLAT